MAEEGTTKVVAPKTVAELEALTELKSTEASKSFAKFLNTHINVEGFEIGEEQAWTVLYSHRVWQQSEERKQEIAAGKEAAEAEKAKRAEEREKKAEEKKAEAARKAAEKKKKEEAKEAAEADSDEDLDDVDTEGEGSITESAAPKKKRTPRAGKSAEGF